MDYYTTDELYHYGIKGTNGEFVGRITMVNLGINLKRVTS